MKKLRFEMERGNCWRKSTWSGKMKEKGNNRKAVAEKNEEKKEW